MIYEICIGENTHFMEFDDKRQASAWAIQQAGIEVRHATPEAIFAHLQGAQPTLVVDGADSAIEEVETTSRRRNGKPAPVGA